MPAEKPFVLQFYNPVFGGWEYLIAEVGESDDPAEFDTLKEARTLAKEVAYARYYNVRVRRRSDSKTVAEYRSNGSCAI